MAARLERYLQLIKAKTVYAEHMRVLSRTIFGEPADDLSSKNKKVITLLSEKPMQKRPEIVDYYITNNNVEKFIQQLITHGLYRDAHAEFIAHTEKKRLARGKVKWIPPQYREGAKKK